MTIVMSMRTVDAALTSGVTENRTIEYTLTGKVRTSGPVVKNVMTKSSSESVKDRSAPAMRAGFICGRIISFIMRHSPAPEISCGFFDFGIE